MRSASDLLRLREAPSIQLGCWPTPIESYSYGGTELQVKRDDLSGYGRGGVKTRKIEHLLSHLVHGGFDHLITVVANVTNLAHDILPALLRLGIRSDIFVTNDPRVPELTRRGLFAEMSSVVRLVGSSRTKVTQNMLAAAASASFEGRRPFLALPSLAHPVSVAGTARGYLEMAEQLRTAGKQKPRTLFITAASGATLAGFLLAENALRAEGHSPTRIIGVQVYPGAIKTLVHALIRWTEFYFPLNHRMPADRIEMFTSTLDGGFGVCSRHVVQVCERVESDLHLRIDPFFGGKTWLAMDSFLCRASTEERRDVLYWHCGYTPDWRSIDSSLGA